MSYIINISQERALKRKCHPEIRGNLAQQRERLLVSRSCRSETTAWELAVEERWDWKAENKPATACCWQG